MRLRRGRPPEPASEFGWREIVCPDEESAAAEAERRQADEDPDEVEWIFLRSEETGQWLARRTPTHLVRREPFGEAFLTWLLDPFGWWG